MARMNAETQTGVQGVGNGSHTASTRKRNAMTVRELRKIARFLVREVKGVAVQAYAEHGHPVHASLTIGEDGSVSAHVSINEPRCQSTQGREELRTPSAGSSQRDHSRAQFGHQDAHPSYPRIAVDRRGGRRPMRWARWRRRMHLAMWVSLARRRALHRPQRRPLIPPAQMKCKRKGIT